MVKKTAISTLLILAILGAIITFQFVKFNDGKLHIVFCDVGQGDGIFIRSPSGKNFLVDAGPGDKISSCAESHMPFWDRTISFGILTHPHADHFTGFTEIINRYNVLNFGQENIQNDTVGYRSLKNLISQNNINSKLLYAGDVIKSSDGLRFTVLGPSQEFLDEVSPKHLINKSSEQATLVILLSYGGFDVLLTGDAQDRQVLDNIQSFNVRNVEILKVPHHGSKTGLNDKILDLLNEKYAVISVGEKNRYGHPNPFTLNLLEKHKIPILRTDRDGDIEFVSDGQNFGRIIN